MPDWGFTNIQEPIKGWGPSGDVDVMKLRISSIAGHAKLFGPWRHLDRTGLRLAHCNPYVLVTLINHSSPVPPTPVHRWIIRVFSSIGSWHGDDVNMGEALAGVHNEQAISFRDLWEIPAVIINNWIIKVDRWSRKTHNVHMKQRRHYNTRMTLLILTKIRSLGKTCEFRGWHDQEDWRTFREPEGAACL